MAYASTLRSVISQIDRLGILANTAPYTVGLGPHPPSSGLDDSRPADKAETCWQRWFLRKEVIQPHLPVRLPCYDFVPVTSPTLGVCLLAVGSTTLGVADFHDVTGGVYKARERIHRSNADLRLLATPASCRRVAACNPY